MSNKTQKLIADIQKEFSEALEKYETGEYNSDNLGAVIEYSENAVKQFAQEHNDKMFIESTLEMFKDGDFESDEQKVEALGQALSMRGMLF